MKADKWLIWNFLSRQQVNVAHKVILIMLKIILSIIIIIIKQINHKIKSRHYKFYILFDSTSHLLHKHLGYKSMA